MRMKIVARHVRPPLATMLVAWVLPPENLGLVLNTLLQRNRQIIHSSQAICLARIDDPQQWTFFDLLKLLESNMRGFLTVEVQTQLIWAS